MSKVASPIVKVALDKLSKRIDEQYRRDPDGMLYMERRAAREATEINPHFSRNDIR